MEDRVLETRRTSEGYIRRRRRRTMPDGAAIVYTTVELPEDIYLRLTRGALNERVANQHFNVSRRQQAYAQLRALFEEGLSPPQGGPPVFAVWTHLPPDVRQMEGRHPPYRLGPSHFAGPA
jgi:hypothetical protein